MLITQIKGSRLIRRQAPAQVTANSEAVSFGGLVDGSIAIPLNKELVHCRQWRILHFPVSNYRTIALRTLSRHCCVLWIGHGNTAHTWAVMTTPWSARSPAGRTMTRVTASASMPSVTLPQTKRCLLIKMESEEPQRGGRQRVRQSLQLPLGDIFDLHNSEYCGLQRLST